MIILNLLILFSLALILSFVSKKMGLPGLIGMMAAGIILSSYLRESLMPLSDPIREIALIIILIRAGLSLKFEELKQAKLPIFLLSFLPACFEITAYIFLSKFILGFSYKDGFLLGSVIAAVSPAVIVPSMLKVIANVKNKQIPKIVLAAASLDDVVVIVLFSFALSLHTLASPSLLTLLNIPIKIILAIIIGIGAGYIVSFIIKKMPYYIQAPLLMIISYALVLLEKYILFASLVSIILMAIILHERIDVKGLKKIYSKAWFIFEILLFSLIGLIVRFDAAKDIGIIHIILLVLGSLLVRLVGAFISCSFSGFSIKERLFIILSYVPKATVQAAIGPVALSVGIDSGSTILLVAVISIILTAPVGALIIDYTYRQLLE